MDVTIELRGSYPPSALRAVTVGFGGAALGLGIIMDLTNIVFIGAPADVDAVGCVIPRPSEVNISWGSEA